MSIFTKNTPTHRPLGSLLGLIHGVHGGGKSTIAAGFDKKAVIDTEGGHRGFDSDAYALALEWPQIKESCLFVAAHKTEGTVIFDSISRAYDRCRKHVLTMHGWQDEKEGGGWGEGFKAVRAEFRSAIDPLIELNQRGVGVWFVTHSTESVEVIEKPTGDVTIRSVTPEVLDRKTYDALVRMADVVIHYAPEHDGDKTKHVARFFSDGVYEAKDRTGRFPATLVLPEVSGSLDERSRLVFAAINEAYEGEG